MKVLVIGSDRNLFKEGSAVRQRVLRQAEGLEAMTVVVFTLRGYETINLSPAVSIVPTNSRSKWHYIKDARRIGREIVGEGKNWVISAQDPFESGLAGLKIVRGNAAKLHIQIHTDFLSPFFVNGSFLNQIRRWIARRVLPKADGIRVVSKRISESFSKKGFTLRTTPEILPIFVDLATIRQTNSSFSLHERYPQFEPIVLMVSRLEPEKDFRTALNAFEKIQQKFPKAGLVIVGSGSEHDRIIQITQERRLNAVCGGWQTDPISYYKTADLFLATSRYEGFGASMIEAAAAGLPVVTTDVGIAGELIKDGINGAICPVGDSICLAEKVISLLTNSQKLNEIRSRNAGETFGLFSEEEYFKKYQQMWQKLFLV